MWRFAIFKLKSAKTYWFTRICSVRIPSLEYSLFTWNLSIFRFNLAVLLYRLGKSISFSRFKFKNCDFQKYDRFFVLQVCHLRQTFKPTAESCIFVHIILQETEECKMWPKFICTFFWFVWFKISMCICSVRIPSLEYSLFTWNLSIFRFNLAVLLYRYKTTKTTKKRLYF
jgi:hypothetical protein